MASQILSHLIKFSLTLTVISWTLSAQSETIEQLINEGSFFLETRIIPEDNIIVGQEVTLLILLKTDRWFTAGTQFSLPEIPGAVVTQREYLALNNTEVVDGIAWTSQQWEVSIFPQVSGAVTVPQITLKVTVNNEAYGTVSGRINTRAQTFQVAAPAAMTEENNWVVASDYSLKREIIDTDFTGRPGESLRIVVTTRAESTLAMMLPVVQFMPVDGLGIYPQSPQLQNLNQRGAKTAVRKDVVDIVVEKSGHYYLPPIRHSWFDSASQQQKVSELPALTIISGEGIKETEESLESESFAPAKNPFPWIMVAAGILMFLLMLVLYRFRQTRKSSGSLSESQVFRHIRKTAKQEDLTACIHWLYVWLDNFSEEAGQTGLRQSIGQGKSSELQETVDALLKQVYSERGEHKSLGPLSKFRKRHTKKQVSGTAVLRLPEISLTLNP